MCGPLSPSLRAVDASLPGSLLKAAGKFVCQETMGFAVLLRCPGDGALGTERNSGKANIH